MGGRRTVTAPRRGHRVVRWPGRSGDHAVRPGMSLRIGNPKLTGECSRATKIGAKCWRYAYAA